MSFIGNINGPRESTIIDNLSAVFFGISGEELESDVSYHMLAESRSEIVPTRLDASRRPYIILSGPKIGITHFYLRDNGYELSGDVLVIHENGNLYTEKLKK